MSRKLFLFPRVSIKVCIGWAEGGVEWVRGVDPVACESSVPSESVCVRVCLCVHWILLHCSPLSVSAS